MSEDCSLHPSLIHITNCESVCICLALCWGKHEKERKHECEYGRNHCHLRSVLENTFPNVHWLSLPTAKQEEICNIKTKLWEWKYLCMYFLFFHMLALIYYIPDNWQNKKLEELIWFLLLNPVYLFHVSTQIEKKLDSPSLYRFSFISSNGLAHCKLAFLSGLIKSFYF